MGEMSNSGMFSLLFRLMQIGYFRWMTFEDDAYNKITAIGKYQGRYSSELVGIKDSDRMRHMYVLGRTGAGKTTLLLNMAISDIQRGKAVCVIDPHGELATALLSYVPPHRVREVIYFNAADTNFPFAFNPLYNNAKKDRFLLVSGIIGTFRKIWMDSWGNRMEHILRYCILSLLEYPAATLLDITRILTDDSFRAVVLRQVQNPVVQAFWHNEFGRYTPGLRQEAIGPIINKMGLFSTNTALRNIVGQCESSINLHEIMAANKILICNLSKGVLGEDACSLLGSVLISGLQVAAQRRAMTQEMFRLPFFLYVDEMHSFITQSFIDILAELRKYNFSIFLTHQFLEQIHPKIASAIFGNVGSIISFGLGNEDASLLAKEFGSAILPRNFIDLPRYHMILRLMVDGVVAKPFTALALPITAPKHDLKDLIIIHTRKHFCKAVEEVETDILVNFNRRADNQQGLFS